MGMNFDDASRTTVPGVYAKSGVVLCPRLRGFLAALRLKSGFDLIVTSGIRTTAAQASAMRTKVELLGNDGLDIYNKSLADEVIAGGTASTSAIQATLDRQVARGTFMSRHMKGDALDFRTRGMDPGQLETLQAAVKSLGANQLYEASPPHLHVEDIPAHFMAADPLSVSGALLALGVVWWGFSE